MTAQTKSPSGWSKFVNWLRAIDEAFDAQPHDLLYEQLKTTNDRVAKLEGEVRQLHQSSARSAVHV